MFHDKRKHAAVLDRKTLPEMRIATTAVVFVGKPRSEP
jgi:hypothetical protein